MDPLLAKMLAKETKPEIKQKVEPVKVDSYLDRKQQEDWSIEVRPANPPVDNKPAFLTSIPTEVKDDDFCLTPPPEFGTLDSNQTVEAEFYSLITRLSEIASDNSFREQYIRGIARCVNSGLSDAALRLKCLAIEKAGIYMRVAEQEIYLLSSKSPMPESNPANLVKAIRLTASEHKEKEPKEKKTDEQKFVEKMVKLGIAEVKARELWLATLTK